MYNVLNNAFFGGGAVAEGADVEAVSWAATRARVSLGIENLDFLARRVHGKVTPLV